MDVTQISAGIVLDEVAVGAQRRRRSEGAHLSLVAPADTAVHHVLIRESIYRRGLALTDLFAAVVAVGVANLATGADLGVLATVLFAAGVVLAAKVAGTYDRDGNVLARTTLDETPTLLQLSALLTFLLWLSVDAATSTAWGSPQAGTLFLVLTGLIVAGRFGCRRVLAAALPAERLLVIAEPSMVRRLREKIEFTGVRAVVVAERDVRGADGRPLAAPTAHELRSMQAQHGIDRVLVAPVSTDAADTLNFIRAAKSVGLRVSLIPRMLEVVGTASSFDHVGGTTMLGVPRLGLTRSSQLLKRTVDVAGSALLLLITAPVLLLVALWIKLDSRGPVLFCQQRVGRDGKTFGICKFRTMTPDAEALKDDLRRRNEAGGLFKIANDPRVTRAGRFLRATSLDELPQLLNVLRGDMSLVGPRPLVPDEDEMITGAHRHRLMLTPGMTGPWQILGSSRIPLEEMVNIDYLYVANWSIWRDIATLLRTVPYALGRRSQ